VSKNNPIQSAEQAGADNSGTAIIIASPGAGKRLVIVGLSVLLFGDNGSETFFRDSGGTGLVFTIPVAVTLNCTFRWYTPDRGIPCAANTSFRIEGADSPAYSCIVDYYVETV